ncbi:MAG: hypothetical protein J7K96_09840, partial [Desulfobacteraceae bacterium]|nr:hypothetical protein [Desulfobacteraceae bacterium]
EVRRSEFIRMVIECLEINIFTALIIVSAKADLSFPNVSIGKPVMCYSEHRFRLKACRNDIVLAETMTKAIFPLVSYLYFLRFFGKLF